MINENTLGEIGMAVNQVDVCMMEMRSFVDQLRGRADNIPDDQKVDIQANYERLRVALEDAVGLLP